MTSRIDQQLKPPVLLDFPQSPRHANVINPIRAWTLLLSYHTAVDILISYAVD
jgi:hypothetical protein